MTVGLFAGSFDPPTLGHLDLIVRGSQLFSKLYVGIAKNVSKETLFTMEERIVLLSEIVEGIPNVEVKTITGLTVEFAKTHHVSFLLSGVRLFSAAESFQLAAANKKISGLETIFLMADPQLAHISSSLLKEVALNGHHLKDFVPAIIEAKVRAKFRSF